MVVIIIKSSAPRIRLPLCGVGVKEEVDVCWEVVVFVMQAPVAVV